MDELIDLMETCQAILARIDTYIEQEEYGAEFRTDVAALKLNIAEAYLIVGSSDVVDLE